MLNHTYILPSLFLLLRIFFCSILNIFFFCSPFAWSWKKELLISFLHMYFTEKKTAIFPFPSPLLSFFPVVLWCVLGFFCCCQFLLGLSFFLILLLQRNCTFVPEEEGGLSYWFIWFHWIFFFRLLSQNTEKRSKIQRDFFPIFSVVFFFLPLVRPQFLCMANKWGAATKKLNVWGSSWGVKNLKLQSSTRASMYGYVVGLSVCACAKKNTSQCPVMTMTGGSRYSLCSAPYTYIYTRTPLWLLCYCADVACAGRRGPIPLSIPNKLKLFTSPPSPSPSTFPLPSPSTPPSSFSSICQSPIDPILLCRRHRGWVLMLARPRYMVDYPSS